LAADEVRHRASLDAPADQLAILLAHLVTRQLAVPTAVQVDAPAAQDVRQQHLRIQAWELCTLLREETLRPLQQSADGPGLLLARRAAHASPPFASSRRCFLSYSRRAPMTSPISPAMMASSLYRVRLMR